MKTLVTGHYGYLGTHVTPLLSQPWTGWDLPDVDITDAHRVSQRMAAESPDTVIHLAAATSVAECEWTPGNAYAVNVQGTINLLKAAEACGVRRFVFASSMAAQSPQGVYGWTKWTAEKAVTHFSNPLNRRPNPGMETVVLRFTNLAGESHDSRTHLIPNLIRYARRPSPPGFPVYGSLDNVKNFLYVKEAAQFVADAATTAIGYADYATPGADRLQSLVRPLQVFSCGGVTATLRAVIDTLQELTGVSIPLDLQPARDGDAPYQGVDLDLQGRVPLETILASAWKSPGK